MVVVLVFGELILFDWILAKNIIPTRIPTLVGRYAGVAEQADARDLKSPEGNLVRVRFPSSAPFGSVAESPLHK